MVYFCYAGKIGRFLSRGRLGYERVESPYLEIFQEESRVHLINTCDELDGVKNELNFIRKLQGELEPAVSLFIDGDILKYSFLRQLLPWQKRLLGNNFSLICLSEFIHVPVGRFQALKELWLFIYHHLIDRHIFVHRVDFVAKFPWLNKFFLRSLRRFNLLTAVFCPDPGLVEQLGHSRVLFLPEPNTNDLQAKNTPKKSSFYARVKSQYLDFLERNKSKHVLLMFGDLESRKGYDLLLQLAARDPGCVCVRFGRTKGDYTATWAAILGKEKLMVEDRLFELDTYVESQELIDFIFSTVRFMILPYRQYYRTSGVLIDVLRRGLPVLTSDKGAMARIVRYYRVGRVFPDGNLQELQKEFSGFKEDYKNYLKNIEKFNIDYSEKKCEEILSVMLK
jgi:glycosyltransferase involved in cell wall biosynthesis